MLNDKFVANFVRLPIHLTPPHHHAHVICVAETAIGGNFEYLYFTR